MAITSKGYAGTVNDVDWATMARYHGRRWSTKDRAALACTQNGSTKTFDVAAGEFMGDGILDVNSATINLAPTVPVSGGQWFLVVAHRVWATKLTTIITIAGATTTITPPTVAPTAYPTLSATPGTSCDQPLFWVWVNASNTTVRIVDIRDLPLSTTRRGDATARDLYWGASPTALQGRYLQDIAAQFTRTDLGCVEQYYEAFDSTLNPLGASPAGWHPVEGRLPFGQLKRSGSAASVATGTAIVLADLIAEFADGCTLLAGGAGTAQITVPRDGIYEISAGVIFSVNATGARQIFVTKNSAAFNVGTIAVGSGPASAATFTQIIVKRFVKLAANDVLRLFVFQNSGGALGIEGSPSEGSTFFAAKYVGRPLP